MYILLMHFLKTYLLIAKRKRVTLGTSLVAQWVRLHAPNAGCLGSIPGLGRALEEGMASHSCILAWRIPCTEEPGDYSP